MLDLRIFGVNSFFYFVDAGTQYPRHPACEIYTKLQKILIVVFYFFVFEFEGVFLLISLIFCAVTFDFTLDMVRIDVENGGFGMDLRERLIPIINKA
jgi:hypothetical protein